MNTVKNVSFEIETLFGMIIKFKIKLVFFSDCLKEDQTSRS